MKMKIDLDRNYLSFAVNHGDFKECAKILPSDTPYFVAICMNSTGGQVAMLNDTVCTLSIFLSLNISSYFMDRVLSRTEMNRSKMKRTTIPSVWSFSVYTDCLIMFTENTTKRTR